MEQRTTVTRARVVLPKVEPEPPKFVKRVTATYTDDKGLPTVKFEGGIFNRRDIDITYREMFRQLKVQLAEMRREAEEKKNA